MSEHIFYLVWIFILALFVGRKSFHRYELVEGQYEWRCAWPMAIIIWIPIVWNAANRGYFADTTMYIMKFYSMPDSLSAIPSYLASTIKDKGFYLISAWIKAAITKDVVFYLLIFAAFEAFSLASVFRKYSCNYIFSVFLFIASTDYLSWMYNGLRQFLAVTIVFVATPFILRRKYIPAIAFILIASTFHRSALIMIPIVFIANGRAWNSRTILLLLGAIVAAIFAAPFMEILDESLSTTQYANVVSDATMMKDDGTNPIRVLVYSVPAIMAFIKRKEIKSENDAVMNFCTNTAIITAGLYLVSMVTSGIFIGRLPIYVSLYNYILLPWMIENVYQENRNIFFYGCIGAYLMFFYVQMHLMWGYI